MKKIQVQSYKFEGFTGNDEDVQEQDYIENYPGLNTISLQVPGKPGEEHQEQMERTIYHIQALYPQLALTTEQSADHSTVSIIKDDIKDDDIKIFQMIAENVKLVAKAMAVSVVFNDSVATV